jgi:metallo-beta-lactamase class B
MNPSGILYVRRQSFGWVAAAFLFFSCNGIAAERDRLTQPIAPEYARRWLGSERPVLIHGNTYFVGFTGLSIVLIRTEKGLILIDGALPQAVSDVEANIRELGFDIRQVRYILSTEPHYDHSGGLAALAQTSGATVLASPDAVDALSNGRFDEDDPQAQWLKPFPPVHRLAAIRDGATVSLGDVVITAVATPGHTRGSMSWVWRSCENDGCKQIVFASSLNPLVTEGFRYSSPANRKLLAGFLRSIERLRKMPCDILLTAHPDQSGADKKLALLRRTPSPNPFVDPEACSAYADKYRTLLDAVIEAERRIDVQEHSPAQP